jgi:hypothetical protein
MSEKWNKYRQIKVTPENVRALKKLAKQDPYQPSINQLVNRIIRVYWFSKLEKTEP